MSPMVFGESPFRRLRIEVPTRRLPTTLASHDGGIALWDLLFDVHMGCIRPEGKS